MKKLYVLDTNVFIYEPDCLSLFEDNDIYISPVTLREITELKNRDGEAGYSARKVKSKLDELRRKYGPISSNGLPLGDGLGRLFIIPGIDDTEFLPGMSRTSNDDYILASASWLSKNKPTDEVILVTDDVDMQFLADLIGVKTQHFRNKSVSDSDLSYSGRAEILLSPDDMLEFRSNERIKISDDLIVNEFVIARDSSNFKNTILARYIGNGVLIKLPYLEDNGREVRPSDIVAKNCGQRFAQSAILAPASEIPLVIIQGPAGTAKTFISLACGLDLVLNKEEYKRILITRANVEMDATYGYLPGTEEEKVGPMMRPFLDNLEVIMGKTSNSKKKFKDGKELPNEIQYLFDNGYVKAEAMQYMRGRSISNTFVIIDEAQNCTPNQILSIVSRIGNGSKIILIGDPNQIDNKMLNKRNNGLVFAANRFKGSKLCCQLVMEQSECVRSPLAAEAAERLKSDK